jgi:hypothetical protein
MARVSAIPRVPLHHSSVSVSTYLLGVLLNVYRLLVFATQVFAPTHILITFEREGPGRFTEQEISEIVERNSSGEVVGLKLPDKSVMISNHQVCLVSFPASTLPIAPLARG